MFVSQLSDQVCLILYISAFFFLTYQEKVFLLHQIQKASDLVKIKHISHHSLTINKENVNLSFLAMHE